MVVYLLEFICSLLDASHSVIFYISLLTTLTNIIYIVRQK